MILLLSKLLFKYLQILVDSQRVSAWDQDIEFIIKTGNDVDTSGHFDGKGHGDRMKDRATQLLKECSFSYLISS